jgi:hypothetical protein
MNETESRISPPEVPRSGPRHGLDAATEEGRLTQALEEYRALLEAGRKPDRHEFLRRYPEIAVALSECLAGLEFIHEVAADLSQVTTDHPPPPLATEGLSSEQPLGDFRILREVGKGGMGIVYEADFSGSQRIPGRGPPSVPQREEMFPTGLPPSGKRSGGNSSPRFSLIMERRTAQMIRTAAYQPNSPG